MMLELCCCCCCCCFYKCVIVYLTFHKCTNGVFSFLKDDRWTDGRTYVEGGMDRTLGSLKVMLMLRHTHTVSRVQ